MSTIRIQGVMNTTALARGEVMEVQRTDRVERLIAFGYVRELPADGRAADPIEPVIVRVPADLMEEIKHVPAVEVLQEEAPARNALTADWLTFVRRLGIDEPDNASRDKLIADYDEYLAALGGTE